MKYAFDPELAPFTDMLTAADPHDLEATRHTMTDVARNLPAYESESAIEIVDQLVDGPRGTSLPVRLYRPSEGRSGGVLPAIVHLHWGGFDSGSIDVIDALSRQMADQVGALVLAVSYRLAPEAPHPAALEDSYTALTWLAEHADDLGIDPARIAVAGNSAGGGLAAAVSLLARDRGGPAVRFQALVFAQLDDRLNTVSAREFTDTPMWTRESAQVSWRHYLGELTPGSPSVSPYAAPARMADLTGLPPAFVTACEFDPFRDEDLTYGHRLVQAGVPVELHLYPGTFHASTAIADAAISRRMVADQIGALTRALNGAPSS
ncbi:alpha/beta hydrolase [Rhodococcoides yunnanense]|uniref:Alpha/beta hydrolase n=1 Tax=Rhodococcoides yunnanense TaxID=278209 RepID=A0ABU4BK55_9NOCA|nr:alpha/beta hydrolase [Rhodococcus yunnanensis]MDV6264602.1 alpha/beta hydrolase [Rhodococcus yunnanensis]